MTVMFRGVSFIRASGRERERDRLIVRGREKRWGARLAAEVKK